MAEQVLVWTLPGDTAVLQSDNYIVTTVDDANDITAQVSPVIYIEDYNRSTPTSEKQGNILDKEDLSISSTPLLCLSNSAVPPACGNITNTMETCPPADTSQGGDGTVAATFTSVVKTSPKPSAPPKAAQTVYKCELCSATFNRIGNCKRHQLIHVIKDKEDVGFKCNTCDRSFLQRCDLRRHEAIHSRTQPYQCLQCEKGYIRQSDLNVHMRFHKKEKPYSCPQCEKNFYQTGDLNRHVRGMHEGRRHMTCGYCFRRFAKETTLLRHMRHQHCEALLQSATAAAATAAPDNVCHSKPTTENGGELDPG